ncbi:hypothetical protein [Paucibacter soli]|uniref:hypothetical protein n=1 Tax=Paucibacter soli TaxID=3133433 RepID=UPI0030A3426A
MLSLVARLVFTVFTVLLVLGLMAVALVTVLGLVLWSLLRGRRPVVDLSGLARARQFRPGARKAAGEVVDVEAREVPSAAPRLE